MSAGERWSDGIILVGQYNPLQTGCWLLHHGRSAAVLELPPHGKGEGFPVEDVRRVAAGMGLTVIYLLCSHCHGDHFHPGVLAHFRQAFPEATAVLQEGFSYAVPDDSGTRCFRDGEKLELDGEPLYLVHAPKHSWTDTMVVFRGAIFTGDWELNTIRSVHDDKGVHAVPRDVKLRSIARMARFQEEEGYRIHEVFAVHANDRRHDVDFDALMADTREDRKLW